MVEPILKWDENDISKLLTKTSKTELLELLRDERSLRTTAEEKIQGYAERLSEQTDKIRAANKILAEKKSEAEKILAIIRFEIATRFPTAEAIRYDPSHGSAVYPAKSSEELRLREFECQLSEFIGSDNHDRMASSLYSSPQPQEKWSV